MASAASRRADAAGKDPKQLYATLGVSVTADENEIRKAYRRLALKWHPDKNPDNPSATAEFQKISAAYEVLSDAERRDLYDSTGCVDAEELEEAGDLAHATDLFSFFFSGGAADDLDEEEQVLFDDFLRFAGASAFRRKPRRGKKGKAGKKAGGKRRGARMSEEEMMGNVFMAAMADMGGAEEPWRPSCPKGHALKRTKADGEYECNVCGKDILEGKRLFTCKKCDFDMCQKCVKAAEAAELEAAEAEMLEVFVDMHTSPVRKGNKLQLRCEICKAILATKEKATEHMAEKHRDLLEEEEDGLGPDDIASLMMGMRF